MAAGRVPLWCWWIGLVFLLSAPWMGFTPEPQWHRLNLVPFADPTDKPRDLILNIGLFVPFGFSFLKHARRGPRVFATAGAGALVSLCAEVPQLLSTMRHPSATDVLAAVVGSVAGALLRLVYEKNAG